MVTYAPAKLNLSLDVVGKRNDGYHLVKMIMQAVDLYDIVTVHNTNDEKICIECTNSAVPCNSSNIAYRAAEEFFKYTDIKNTGVVIGIDKRIPMQAGLAGGSTDGAAALVALNKLFNAQLTLDKLAEIGAKIGADIPFCIYGGTMYAEGIGTVLKPITSLPKCYFVIVKPDISVSTKEAYAMTDKRSNIGTPSTDILLNAIENGDLDDICKSLHNDFEAVLQLSDVEEIHKDFNANGALGSCMSGSGSAVFGIFASEADAQYCANAMKDRYEFVCVCHPINEGCKIK